MKNIILFWNYLLAELIHLNIDGLRYEGGSFWLFSQKPVGPASILLTLDSEQVMTGWQAGFYKPQEQQQRTWINRLLKNTAAAATKSLINASHSCRTSLRLLPAQSQKWGISDLIRLNTVAPHPCQELTGPRPTLAQRNASCNSLKIKGFAKAVRCSQYNQRTRRNKNVQIWCSKQQGLLITIPTAALKVCRLTSKLKWRRLPKSTITSSQCESSNPLMVAP